MDSADETEAVDVSGEGRRACQRVETNMAALDSAIAVREVQLGKSQKPGDKAILKAAEVYKAAHQSTLGLNQAQTNIKDHADGYLQAVANRAVGLPKGDKAKKHAEIDRHYNNKYAVPLEKKLQYAQALKIGTVEVGGKKMPLGTVAHNTRQDIQLAKATASLVAEGHSKLEVPKDQAKLSEEQRGCKFASAIVKSAEETRVGRKPEFAVKSEAEKAAAPTTVKAQAEEAAARSATNNFKQQVTMGLENAGGIIPTAPKVFKVPEVNDIRTKPFALTSARPADDNLFHRISADKTNSFATREISDRAVQAKHAQEASIADQINQYGQVLQPPLKPKVLAPSFTLPVSA